MKLWYNDPAMIGRHFLVHSKEDPRVKRQYTICCSLNPAVYSELMALARGVLEGSPSNFNYAIMLGKDQSWIRLTIKNYQMAKGLSTMIHGTAITELKQNKPNPDDTYFIKGPMGRGLHIQPTGLHVAFCAGTGVLVFLDLVAHLLILNTFKADGKPLPEEMHFYRPGFKLHLYVSF
jgi:hypothetical protein